MSGALGSIGGLLAPIAGGFLGSGLGELAGNVFGSTASSLLTPTILADIGGAVGGAGAGALTNKNRGVGALTGGLEGLLTGPGLTNLTGVSTGLSGGHVIPILDSLFGGAGWGHTPTAPATGYTLGSAGGGAGTAAAGSRPNPLATPGGSQNMGLMGGASGAYNSIPAVAAQNPQTAAALGGPYAAALAAGLGTAALNAAAGGAGPTAATQSAAYGSPVGGTGAGGLLGNSGGVLGSGISLPQMLALLGGGGAIAKQLAQGGAANMPNAGQFNALAQEAMGNTGMANALRSGVLPPGAEQMAEAGLADSEAGIRARYAAMGLSGSTMEGQDLARAQMQTEAQKYQMAQSAAQYGMQNMQLADTIYGQIADYQLQQDKQLQDALAAFASAASGGSINYGIGGAANTNLNSLTPTGTGP